MRAIFSFPFAILLAGYCAYPALAQSIYHSPVTHRPLGIAPDACGPGFFYTHWTGTTFGPNYYLRPPWPPESGIGPGGYTGSHGQNGGHPGQYGGHPGQYGGHPGQYGGHPGQGQFGAHPGQVPTQIVMGPNGVPMRVPVPQHRLPHPPHPGMPPQAGIPPHGPAKQPMVTFPTHPYARSPRDFFMWGETIEDEISRLRHPALVP